MTVFKTFLKVLNKCKVPIIMYTVILVCFAGFNMQTSDNSMNYTASKPDILIINKDQESKITQNLVEYMSKNSNLIDIEDNEEARDDALFYRDVNYIIYIPENYGVDFLNGKNPEIEIKSTGDYNSSYAEMMLTRYSKIANIYQKEFSNEDDIIRNINNTLEKEIDVQITSKLDSTTLSKAAFYYNFLSYSILAGSVYVICLIISSFREIKVRKRTIVSSMDYKKHNRQLLFANILLAIVLWVFYVLLSFILLGNIMFSVHGLILMANSFIFTICAVTIAFLIANLINNKNAINGIVNVVALGSSFLCGAFVPVEWLPDTILKIAHILPSYWYIQTNEIVKTLETVNLETIKPILINTGVIFIFCIIFIILTNIVAKKKNKIG